MIHDIVAKSVKYGLKMSTSSVKEIMTIPLYANIQKEEDI